MEEERKIDEFYQIQAKKLVDSFFDLGLLSESLSRDGMIGIDDLVALWFQQIADSAAKVASFTKKYKNVGEKERHEEEMRWIARAKEAEQKVANIDKWVLDMVAFLRKIVVPWPNVDSIRAQHEVAVASQLLHKAFELGLTELDCDPGKIILGDERCAESEPPCPMSVGQWACRCDDKLGSIIKLCPKCGGRKVRVQCEAKHGINRCDREAGHEGPHRYRNGRHREEWG